MADFAPQTVTIDPMPEPTADLAPLLASTELFGGLAESILRRLAVELEIIHLAGGEILVQQGEVDESLYLVSTGRLQMIADRETSGEQLLAEIGPGECVGEMAFLSGQKQTATVMGGEESTVVRLSKRSLERLARDCPTAAESFYQTLQEQVRRRRLRSALQSTQVFGALDRAVLRALETELTWVTLRSGETLIRQGDPGDCLYVVISGRLRIVLERDGEEVRTVREVGRGESIGEMALITGEPRAATVYAIRDTEVARLSQAGFDRLLAQHPHAMTKTFTRSIIGSLNRQLAGEKPGVNAFITVAIVPTSQDLRLADFARQLVQALAPHGSTLHLSSGRVDEYLGKAGSAQTHDASDQAAGAQLVAWLSEQETKYRHIVYEADPAPTAWSQRCLRQADHLLIVGHATANPAPGELEMALLGGEEGRARKRKSLVLLHRTGARMPRGTQRWLALRQVDQHFHVRWQNEADFGRLARCVAGRAVGLALGGGAARGFAHIGVIRALEEAGIPIDRVGGTSAGALIAAQYAMGWDAQQVLDASRTYVQAHQHDYTLPFVALLSGRRTSTLFQMLFGQIDIQDLWLPYFCISTNLTQATKMIHSTGPLWRGVRASNGLPGLLPPLIHNGDALVDGGLLDNLPMGVMRTVCGSGTVIAVDVTPPVDLAKIEPYGDGISGWQALQNKLNPFAPQQNLPNLLTLLYRTVEIGSVHEQKSRLQQGLADLYLRPPVEQFAMSDHRAIDAIAEVGYRYAREAIAQWQGHGITDQK
jgi:lysophospholipid hydrolase